MEAYQKGYNNYRDDNPYDEGTWEYYDFEQGQSDRLREEGISDEYFASDVFGLF